MTIALGSHDPQIGDAALEYLFASLRQSTSDRSRRLRDDKGWVPLRPLQPRHPLSVTDLQQRLLRAGFLPGGRIDGICGYRTRAAIRLFQEYVRSIEGRACVPDGLAGPVTLGELDRWESGLQVADWTPRMQDWSSGDPLSAPDEFTDWLALLGELQQRTLQNPDKLSARIDAFDSPTDTRKTGDWSVSANDVHLVGIRFGAEQEVHHFDDVLVLLVKGLAFRFQASADPGQTSNPAGAPFLVRGQHDFRIGLHQNRYHALRPLNHATHGVLVVRSRHDLSLSAEDLDAELETNGTINIHWGGKGVGRPVRRWSEGCQIVAGSYYQRPQGEVIDCSSYVAINNREVRESTTTRTRGAYNVLSDLMVALTSDMQYPGEVRYTLLHAADLEHAPALARSIAASRQAGRKLIDGPETG